MERYLLKESLLLNATTFIKKRTDIKKKNGLLELVDEIFSHVSNVVH